MNKSSQAKVSAFSGFYTHLTSKGAWASAIVVWPVIVLWAKVL